MHSSSSIADMSEHNDHFRMLQMLMLSSNRVDPVHKCPSVEPNLHDEVWRGKAMILRLIKTQYIQFGSDSIFHTVSCYWL